MNKARHFPNFWETFALALQKSASRLGILAYLPWFLAALTCLGFAIPYGLAWLCQPELGVTDTIAALSALIVVGGLLMAVSVACMTQIYVTVSDPMFGDYLKEEEIFDQFLFWPQLTLLFQITYIVVCGLDILIALCTKDGFVRLTEISTSITLLIYIVTKTWQLIDAMRLLGWHRQEYASLLLKIQRQSGHNESKS